MSIIQKLTEGIVNRDLRKEGSALLEKWENTGLLEGLTDDHTRQSMSLLLENQAKELLREASTMEAGNVEGFASVAFPIVRRVFGSLVANELVSVQPMSLPSGLIFFLDFQKSSANAMAGFEDTSSLYGGGVVGHEITGGVNLDGPGAGLSGSNADSGFYNLNNGYSSPTGSSGNVTLTLIASGVVGSGENDDVDGAVTAASLGNSTVKTSLSKLCRYDPDLSGSIVGVYTTPGADAWTELNKANLIAVTADRGDDGAGELDPSKAMQVRRLTQLVGRSTAHANRSAAGLDPADGTNTSLLFVLTCTGAAEIAAATDQSHANTAAGADEAGLHVMLQHVTAAARNFSFPLFDDFTGTPKAGSGREGVGAVAGTSNWGLETDGAIPEIDIQVDSVSITAMTKKLKAKWSPELGQDLNAYHNLDAEVELTSILSEQIALEIDREILNDLIQGATAGTYYWSRRPGKFVRRKSGGGLPALGAGSDAADEGGPEFTGTVSEWYETLVETINDVSAQIHRKTLRGGANFIVCGPEVANILEFTAGFRANVTGDDTKGTVGTVNVGSISKKWDVYVDPYFPRNVVLAGRKGGSFLESGYVYAPYVPLQVTPTIFGVEDFVPRKGVMTRYAKKMVRPDMYGLVIVQDLLG